ncbi:MAG: FAD-dependent oxidoreductase [Propionibacteriaceae bacterium]|jgi:electron transfer flavoprotein-quinone oxidoreductase|nr:FAD-dependent oxidoreductase [Propionibacteriaceae bacterium]
MSEDQFDFDVTVVGAGVAGAVTAYLLAQKGLSVALIDRGETPGSKNLSGGVLYCRSMTTVFPDFFDQAPYERRISRNQLVFMTPESSVALDYADERLHRGGTAVTVLRAKLDAWLAERCEEAGVMVMPGTRVDGLRIDQGRVVGVRAGEDELNCRVVVAADGVNSFLCRDAGLRPKPASNQLALGVKAVVKLPDGQLESRFGLAPDHGAALALVGDCTQGVGGGGFLYTNRDSCSVGLVLRLDDLVRQGLRSVDLFDHLLAHPLLERYLADGQLVEYGCHLVAEGGRAMRGQIVHNGLVVVGDAAGLTINTGFTVRGMDLAVGSAIAAAEAVAAAIAADDVSAAGLAPYETALDQSYVGQDMRTFAKAPHFMEGDRLYHDYGPLLADILFQIYHLDTSPRHRLMKVARSALKASPLRLTQLARDGWEGVRAL